MKSINIQSKVSALIVLFLVSIGLSAQIDRSKQPKPGPAPKITLATPGEFELPNGLKVLVVENHKLPRVSYTLTMDNMPVAKGDKAGISGILGAMLGNGTTTISKDDFNEEIDFLGANMNFGSSSAFAGGLSKYSDRLLELLADAAINPLLTEEEFEKEKERQIEGLKAGEKDVSNIASRVSYALSYGTHHPYGEYVTEETLNSITLNNVNAFYQKYFNPNNAYLVVIGDVDFSTIEKQIRAHFGKWNKGAGVDISVPPANPNVQYTQINFVDMPNAVQSNVALTNNVELKMNHPDYHAVKLANYILGGGSSAYLFQNLRESNGYTYGSYSTIGTSKYTSSRFNAYAEVRNEVTDSAIVEMLKEVNRIKNEPVDEEQLKIAKAKYTGNFVMAVEKPSTLANYALDIRIQDLPTDFYSNYLKNINSVTVEDIQRVANTYFKPENGRIIIVGKGSDVLQNLEKTGIPIKYFDKFANPVSKPEFSKPIPDGVTAQSVIDDYINAIGGRDKILAVKTVHSIGDVTIEGAPFKPKAEAKTMVPNKESLELSVEGMGVLMKQKFNGESGYVEQQGNKVPMEGEILAAQESKISLFPELYYDDTFKLSLESLTTIDGNDVYKVKVVKDGNTTFKYYNVETGLLVREESSMTMNGNEIALSADYSKYSPVKGVQFAYHNIIRTGPQTLIFNYGIVKVNEGVTNEDFN